MSDQEKEGAPAINLDQENASHHDSQSADSAGKIEAATPNNPAPAKRGFLPFLVVIPAPASARDFTVLTKWVLTCIVALGALAAPLSSGILYPVLASISRDLHTSSTVVNLSVAFSTLAVAISPLWWSYIAENWGRRITYILSLTIFGIFNIISAFSVNIAMFIVMRMLASAACASLQSVSAGSIADLWAPEQRGKAMGMFFMGPMLGPLLAPIIGGALATRWDWRSTQWFLVIYGFAILLLVMLFLPETSLTLEKRATTIQKTQSESSSATEEMENTARKVLNFLVMPVMSVKLLRFIPILITVYYTSITFAVYYLLNVSVQKVFSSPPYSWSPILVGLTYIPSALGYLMGSFLGGSWTDHIMKREARKAGRVDNEGKFIFRPEDRICENALVACVLYPGALLWWGWTVQNHTFWIVPLIANFFFGFGCMLITNVTMTMLTEFTPKKSSVGVAVTNLLRNSLACVAAVVAEPLIEAIGYGWTFTAACLLCLFSGVSLVLMRRNRERWSENMKSVAEQF